MSLFIFKNIKRCEKFLILSSVFSLFLTCFLRQGKNCGVMSKFGQRIGHRLHKKLLSLQTLINSLKIQYFLSIKYILAISLYLMILCSNRLDMNEIFISEIIESGKQQFVPFVAFVLNL